MESPRKIHKEKGQGLVEYALILVLIAAVVVAGLTVFGVTVCSLFTRVASNWP